LIDPAYAQRKFPDSVEATVIHFKVLPPLDKHGLPEHIENPLKDFYYILWDDFVIIKEMMKYTWSTYRLFDLINQVEWECWTTDSTLAKVYSSEHVVEDSKILVDRSKIDSILGYPVFKCVVGNKSNQLVAWQTEAFGIDFSTIGQLPGVPLYYEKMWGYNKLRFVAREVYHQTLSSEYFDLERMDKVNYGKTGNSTDD
jgi:hypothetical protein